MELTVRHRSTVLAALALASVGCAADSALETGPEVRAQFVDGIILLEARVAGTTGWWILDSGYEYSLVDEAVADEAGLTLSAPETVAQPGGAVTQRWTQPGAVEFAKGTFHADSMAVLDFSGLAPIVGLPIAGLLGHDFFTRYVITIDYAAREVTLAEPEGWRAPAGLAELAVWIENAEPFALGTLWVNDRTVPAKFKLDTGSLSELGLNGSFVAQNLLIPEGWPRLAVSGVAVGGATRNFVARIDSMRFGPVVIPGPVAGWSEDLTRVGDAGTVGAPVLARFRVTFDYTRHRLLLKPTADAARRTVWNGSGMLVAQLPGGPVVVAQIVPGTPAAEAGIAAGDLLVLVGDRPAESIGLDALRAHFRRPGQRDTLVIERDGARHTVALVQRELP
jgi:hypothetical protein